ncbi:MAG: hypothetical protein H6Q89_3771, partial [Myxococcaceae bacterium]|nr:hypothetical protein [Myxococcaceae bacterium]
MRRPLLAGLLVAGLAHAAVPLAVPEEHHEFASTPVGKLQVIETRGELAVVEGEQGEVVLVHLNDRLGLEGAKVDRISRGCLFLSG